MRNHLKVQIPQGLTFRPIVAGPHCVTRKLSEFIDIVLKPVLPKVKSCVKDDLEYLNEIPRELREYECLVTLDMADIHTMKIYTLALIII